MANLIVNTPYDDAYRTMLVKCNELTIPLINEIFNEHYTGQEKIILKQNEHFMLQQGGSSEKRISDSILEIITDTVKKYHCECESTSDGTIMIRMFEYDTQAALEDAFISHNTLEVEFPHSAVIFLRCTRNTPDNMMIRIKVPTGDFVSYPIHVLKIKAYSIDDIFEKKLYMLIPFYIFNLEHDFFLYNDNVKNLQKLTDIYSGIYNRLEHHAAIGMISEYSKSVIYEFVNKVAQNLAAKHNNIQKGIGTVMGGQVLDLEVIKMFDRGHAKGHADERRSIISSMLNKGKTPHEISDLTDLPLADVLVCIQELGNHSYAEH